MLAPQFTQLQVQLHSLLQGLIADRVAAFNSHASDSSTFEKNHSVVSLKFCIHGGAYILEKIMRVSWPVSSAVNRSSVAKKHPVWISSRLDIFQIPLDMIDRPLGGMGGSRSVHSWEASCENHGCCFWN